MLLLLHVTYYWFGEDAAVNRKHTAHQYVMATPGKIKAFIHILLNSKSQSL
jgi:5-carboxymethyl-2-hydroxymuconate isomerase